MYTMFQSREIINYVRRSVIGTATKLNRGKLKSAIELSITVRPRQDSNPVHFVSSPTLPLCGTFVGLFASLLPFLVYVYI
jgi:hypothetical protein